MIHQKRNSHIPFSTFYSVPTVSSWLDYSDSAWRPGDCEQGGSNENWVFWLTFYCTLPGAITHASRRAWVACPPSCAEPFFCLVLGWSDTVMDHGWMVDMWDGVWDVRSSCLQSRSALPPSTFDAPNSPIRWLRAVTPTRVVLFLLNSQGWAEFPVPGAPI